MPATDEPDPWPFEEILRPIVDSARARAGETAPSVTSALDDRAWDRLEDGLMETLAGLTVRALHSEFDRRPRSAFQGGVRRETEDGETGMTYRRFARSMIDQGPDSLYTRYPALEGMTSSAAEAWVAGTTEFLGRLDVDRAAIEATFGSGGRLGRVMDVEPGLSDPHGGGRTVTRLVFATGARAIYKPRDLSPERAFFDFLEWLDRELDLEPASPRILLRDGYGWMEDVARSPCADRAEARLFHYRAGRLLCALHVLGATDVHAGNVIAAGPHPIPVDLETVVQPHSRDAPSDDLLATGILPFWKLGLDGRRYDVGVLTGATARAGIPRIWRCQCPGTDRMELELGYRAVPGADHRAILDGAPVEAPIFAEHVAAGFGDAARLLIDYRDASAALDDALSPFRALRVRVLLRPTLAYVGAGFASLDPELLADPGLRRAAIERFLSESGGAAVAPLGCEIDAVERLDVPLFHARSDRRDLELDGGERLPDHFGGTGFRAVLDRIAGLDEQRLRRSLDLVRSSLRLATLARALRAARPGDRDFPLPS